MLEVLAFYGSEAKLLENIQLRMSIPVAPRILLHPDGVWYVG